MDRKTETLNLRVTPELKGLLRLASTREHRTLSNMVEFLGAGALRAAPDRRAAVSARSPAASLFAERLRRKHETPRAELSADTPNAPPLPARAPG